MRILVFLACILGAVGAARAETPDAIARARTHFQAGQALYKLGNYTDAIREFSAGYALVPRVEFLINLGQSYRKLDDLGKAREMYKRFLAEADPKDPARAQIQSVLSDVEKEIALRPAPKPEPVVVPKPEPKPQPQVDLRPSPGVVVVEQPPKKSWARRNWWVFPVVGAVVIAGAAVGIYFGTRSTQVGCSDASFGCITVMPK
jgi:tetratricopeptide (TPR) repeat protein